MHQLTGPIQSAIALLREQLGTVRRGSVSWSISSRGEALMWSSRSDPGRQLKRVESKRFRRDLSRSALSWRKVAELKRLSITTSFYATTPHRQHLEDLHAHPASMSVLLRYFDKVTAAASDVRDKLQDFFREKWTNVSWRELNSHWIRTPQTYSCYYLRETERRQE